MLPAQKRPGFRLTKACHMLFGITKYTNSVQDMHDEYYYFQECFATDLMLLVENWEANADTSCDSSHKHRRDQIAKAETENIHTQAIVIEKTEATIISRASTA